MRHFETVDIDTGETRIFAWRAGSGAPLLLLHGFPETHLMWRDVAPALTDEFAVVCADLRGYGQSGCPPSAPDHSPYAKRAMARDLVTLMERLGHSRFCVAGHDRGGRVAYRMALDHPQRIERLALLDVIPTSMAWDRADANFALAFWPWSLLAQPEPLPEQLLTAAPEAIVSNAIEKWGSRASAFPPDVKAAYVAALGRPANAHAICEEYRAAATLDREHDEADLAAGRRIPSPLLALWSSQGALEQWYRDIGGPIQMWRGFCDHVEGQAIDAGHFFPEESPDLTARLLARFFG